MKPITVESMKRRIMKQRIKSMTKICIKHVFLFAFGASITFFSVDIFIFSIFSEKITLGWKIFGGFAMTVLLVPGIIFTAGAISGFIQDWKDRPIDL